MARTISLVFLLGLILAAPSMALGCDCNHFPWKPRSCKDQCGSRILVFAKIEDIGDSIPLEPLQLERLLQFRSTMTDETSPEDLRSRFSPEEYDRLLDVFDRVPSSTLVYLVREAERRSGLRERERN